MECGPAKSSKRIVCNIILLRSKNFTLTIFSQKHLKIEREITSSRVLAHVLQNWHANYVEEKKTGKNGEAPRKLYARTQDVNLLRPRTNNNCTRTETARAPTAPDRGPAVLKLVRRCLGAFQPTACGPTPAPQRPLPIIIALLF